MVGVTQPSLLRNLNLNRSDWRIVTRLYRGPMLCILIIFLLALNIRYTENVN